MLDFYVILFVWLISLLLVTRFFMWLTGREHSYLPEDLLKPTPPKSDNPVMDLLD